MKNRLRLNELGLRKPIETVREVIRRLDAGHSLYSMYHEKSDTKLMSKTTVEKIKRLRGTGELDFVLLEVVDAVYPFTKESHKGRTERVSAREESDRREVSEVSGSNLQMDPGSLNDLGVHRLKVVDALPSISWSIKGLEEANIPRDRALSLLSEYDELDIKRVSSVVTEYGEEPKRWIKDFRGIDRYVALHYLVLFKSSGAGSHSPCERVT